MLKLASFGTHLHGSGCSISAFVLGSQLLLGVKRRYGVFFCRLLVVLEPLLALDSAENMDVASVLKLRLASRQLKWRPSPLAPIS